MPIGNVLVAAVLDGLGFNCLYVADGTLKLLLDPEASTNHTDTHSADSASACCRTCTAASWTSGDIFGFIDRNNQSPMLFMWTKSADQTP